MVKILKFDILKSDNIIVQQNQKWGNSDMMWNHNRDAHVKMSLNPSFSRFTYEWSPFNFLKCCFPFMSFLSERTQIAKDWLNKSSYNSLATELIQLMKKRRSCMLISLKELEHSTRIFKMVAALSIPSMSTSFLFLDFDLL